MKAVAGRRQDAVQNRESSALIRVLTQTAARRQVGREVRTAATEMRVCPRGPSAPIIIFGLLAAPTRIVHLATFMARSRAGSRAGRCHLLSMTQVRTLSPVSP